MVDLNLQCMTSREIAEMPDKQHKNLDARHQKHGASMGKSARAQICALVQNLRSLKFYSSLPYAYTEQGIGQLSTVVHSKTFLISPKGYLVIRLFGYFLFWKLGETHDEVLIVAPTHPFTREEFSSKVLTSTIRHSSICFSINKS